MDCKVLITDSAIADLRKIVTFIAQHNPDAAVRLGNLLIDRALSLSSMPQRYPLWDASKGIRKMLLGTYVIYYEVNEADRTVNIIHFWHGARLEPGGG